MSDLRLVPGIGAKKEQELMEPGYGSLSMEVELWQRI